MGLIVDHPIDDEPMKSIRGPAVSHPNRFENDQRAAVFSRQFDGSLQRKIGMQPAIGCHPIENVFPIRPDRKLCRSSNSNFRGFRQQLTQRESRKRIYGKRREDRFTDSTQASTHCTNSLEIPAIQVLESVLTSQSRYKRVSLPVNDFGASRRCPSRRRSSWVDYHH
jgi:hypothetical protein